MLSPWWRFSSSGGRSWAVQGMQDIHEVTNLSWRGGTAAGAAQAPGQRPGTTLTYPLTLDRLPPPLVLSLQQGWTTLGLLSSDWVALVPFHSGLQESAALGHVIRVGSGQRGPEGRKRYFEDRQVTSRHCWTMVWG